SFFYTKRSSFDLCIQTYQELAISPQIGADVSISNYYTIHFVNRMGWPAPRLALVRGGHCETRTPAASLFGIAGPLVCWIDLSALHRSCAFQVVFGNEKRTRADVSELVYRARPLPAAGCQKTVVAPLPDYLRRVPVFGPCCGDDYPNCGSVE